MKQQPNLVFCKNLIAYDFFYYKCEKKSLSNFDLKNKRYIFLDILDLYKEFKQLMRLSKFLIKKDVKKSLLIIITEDNEQGYITKAWLKRINNSNLDIKVVVGTERFPFYDKSSRRKKMILSLVNLESKTLSRYFSLRNTFIINILSLKFPNINTYRIFGSVESNKNKLIFLLVYLEFALKNKLNKKI